MKRLFLMFTLFLLASSALIAQEQPWKHGDDEYLVDLKYARSDATSEWDGTLNGGWLHFVTDRVEVGTAVSVARQAGEEGAGAGPLYEYNFPTLKKGHFFVGGDAQLLAGEMSSLASLRAAARLGYKLHVGNSSSVRVALDFKRPVNQTSEDAGDRLREVGLTIGFSLGVTPETEVR